MSRTVLVLSLDAELEKEFREEASRLGDFRKGSLSEFGEEALRQWLSTRRGQSIGKEESA